MVKVKCDYCGKIFEIAYGDYLKRRKSVPKDACYDCNGLKGREASLQRRADKKISQLETVCNTYGYKLITQCDEYTDCKMKVKYICPKHGVQEQMLDNLIRGHKCIACSYEDRFDAVRYSYEKVEHIVNSVNNNTLLNPEEYKNATTQNLKIKCSCGKIFTTSLATYSRKNRCASCAKSESKGEELVRKYLENNNIEYVQQKRFDECKVKKPLPFDFYLPMYNLAIEYDGEGHYQEHFYSNKSYDPQSALIKTQKYDDIKTNFCLNNGINLLRIPYWEKNNIEIIIKNEINNIGRRYSLAT